MNDTAHAIRIRNATLGDVPAIARIHVHAWQHAYRGIMPDAFLDALAPEQRIARWEREVSAHDEMTVLMAEDSTTSAVLGFCSICPLRDPFPEDATQPPAGEIYTMYVDGAVQGRGVGRLLIAAAEAVMRDRGFARGVLWMLAENHSARAFYERAGWRPDGVAKTVAYGNRLVQEIRLGKDLPQHVGEKGRDDMHVRIARPDDAPAIAAVHARTWQGAYRGHLPDAFLDDLTPTTRLPFWERMLSTLAFPWVTFVAEDEGTVVGFCSVGPSSASNAPGVESSESQTGEVYSIYVLPDRQGGGAGRLLLDRACEAMRAAGFAEAVLWVLAGNAPAIAFYERMGWHDDGLTRQETIAGMMIDERRYHRFLGEDDGRPARQTRRGDGAPRAN